MSDSHIQSGKLYTAAQVAEFLGLRRRNSVYEILEEELPRTRIGPKRGRTMFNGTDVLAYLAGGRE